MTGSVSVFQNRLSHPQTGAELCLEFDENCVLQHFNIDRRSNLLGVKPSEAVGVSWEELSVCAELKEQANIQFEWVRTHLRPAVYRIPLSHLPEGKELEVNIHPMRHNATTPLTFLVIHQVVQVQPPLQQQGPNWEGMYGHSTDVVIVLNHQQRVTYANVHEGTSFPSLQPGNTLDLIMDAESYSLFSFSIMRCLAEMRAIQFEYTRSEGPVPRWFSVNINPVKLDSKHYAVVSMRETSWMKSQLIALEQENQLFQAALAENQSGLVVLNSQGVVTYANTAAESIQGLLPLGPEAAIREGTIILHATDTRSPITSDQLPFEAARRGEHPQALEVIWTHRDDPQSRAFRLTVQPNHASHSDPGGMLIYLQPISEQRLAEQAKLATYQAMSQLVHTVSHDFRVPINNLVNLCALARHPSQADRHPELLQRIDSSARKLKEQLDGLMQLVRSGSSAQRPTDVCRFKDVWKAVQGDVAELQEEFQANIRAYFEPCSEVRFNRAQLRSILFNLVSNALKYSSPNRQPRVEITTMRHEGYAVLTVRDNGLGMDLSTQEHNLWAPFKRVHEREGGKGLGMALIRAVVEQAGGKIEVESTPDQGTSFYVYLPESPVQEAQYSLF